MPEECLFPIGENVTCDQAALVEPLSIGVYAVKQSSLRPSANIAILGSGPIGLSVLLSAQAQGIHHAYVTDKIDQRVKIAENAGAVFGANPTRTDVVKDILDREPAGMDVVFECAGQQETLDQAIELLKPGGKLMLIGIPELDRISFIIDKMRRKEITIINVRRQNNCVQPAIDLLASGKIKVDFMITHRFKLEETQQAFELVHHYRDGVCIVASIFFEEAAVAPPENLGVLSIYFDDLLLRPLHGLCRQPLEFHVLVGECYLA